MRGQSKLAPALCGTEHQMRVQIEFVGEERCEAPTERRTTCAGEVMVAKPVRKRLGRGDTDIDGRLPPHLGESVRPRHVSPPGVNTESFHLGRELRVNRSYPQKSFGDVHSTSLASILDGMAEIALCPRCDEPLLVYESELGWYQGCPECDYMGQPIKV